MPLSFTLLSREGCALCHEMHAELAPVCEAERALLEVLDVDADPSTRSRFGHKVPVLLLNGELVCHGRLDARELAKAIAMHR